MDAATFLRQSTPMLAQRQGLRDQINSMFAARAPVYQQAGQGVLDYNTQKLSDEATRAAREGSFALARTGQTGGSQQIDINRGLGRANDNALRQTSADALSAENALRGQDASTQSSLLSSVDAGLGSGDAIQQALKNLQFQGGQTADYYKGRAVGDASTAFTNALSAYKIGAGKQSGRAMGLAGISGAPGFDNTYAGTGYK